MLHRVGDVGAAAVDPHRRQALVEDPSRRADEGMPREVFLVPRLLADEEHVGMRRTLAEDGLGRVTPEFAALAVLRGPLERGQAAVGGHPGSGGRLRSARRHA